MASMFGGLSVKPLIRRLFSFCAVAFAFIHLTESWLHLPVLSQLLSFFGLMILLCFFVLANPRGMVLPLMLTAAAVFVLWRSAGGDKLAVHLFEGFRHMRLLLPVLLVFPMFSWVLKLEPYVESLMIEVGRRLKKGSRIQFILMTVTQILSSFLMIGAIHFMYRWMQALLENRTGRSWDEFKGAIALRGFALSTLWVISIPSFSYTVSVMQANVALMIVQGLIFALFGVLLAVLMQNRKDRKRGVRLSDELFAELKTRETGIEEQRIGANVREFLLMFLALMAILFAAHWLTGLDLLYLIPIILFPGVALIFFAKKKGAAFAGELKAYLSRELPNKSYEMAVFVATGLFVHAMHLSGWGKAIITAVYTVTDQWHLLNMLFLLPWMIVILSFLGLSPLTIMVLMGSIIQSIHLPYPPELIAFSMTVGSLMGHVLSPITVAAIVLSASNGKSAWFNSVGSNWAYALIFYAAAQAYIQIVLLLQGLNP